MVFADTRNMQTLGRLLSCFEEVGEWAAGASQPEVARAAAEASKLLEKVVLYEVSDMEASMDVVARTVTAIQEIVRDGRSAGEVVFPEELGLGKSPVSPRGKNGEKEGAETPGDGPARDFLPANVDERIFAEFLERQPGVLDDMETLILALEGSGDEGKLGELRRLIHTLKGESGLLGLSDVERLCHLTEDVLDGGRAGGRVDTFLKVKDWLVQAFDFYSGRSTAFEPPDEVLRLLEIQRSPGGEGEPGAVPEPGEKGEPVSFEGDMELLNDFTVEAMEHLDATDMHLLTLETEPQDEEALNAVFRAFHTIKGSAGFLGLDDLGTLSHEAENLLDMARKGRLVLSGGALDAIFDAVDALKRLVTALRDSLKAGELPSGRECPEELLNRIRAVVDGGTGGEPEPEESSGESGMKLGEILVASGKATEEEVEDALEKQRRSPSTGRLGEQLVRDGEVAAKDVAHALRSQRKGTLPKTVKVKETVKVDAERLDRLVETIGELVIAVSIVSQAMERGNGNRARLTQQMCQLDKITRELQELGTSLRMVPIRSTFQKMARMVRDLAKKAGKRIEFSMSGEDTELDKTVVDNIGDPLIHMVRNAVDHGIEASPEERREAGKPETGRIELRAFHKGGNIYIEIEDDGRGLDREAILAKAREKGIVEDGDSMSDREVFNLIFQPGFSTAKKVTDISGRGVGMDVVKRNIEALRGQVEISSEPGRGSVFTIRMPLTLAIIDGMVVRVGSERYIIPTLSIVRSVRPRKEDLTTVFDRGEMLSLHGELIPLFRLDRLFGVEGAEQDPTRAIVVVVEDDGRQTGLLTDELLGQQQIVIKSLGETLRYTPGISGGAIMPDGRVGIILDIGGLVRLANADGRGVSAGAGVMAGAGGSGPGVTATV